MGDDLRLSRLRGSRLRNDPRTPTSGGLAAILTAAALVAAVALGGACSESGDEPGAPAARVLRDERPPEPTAVPRNPTRRLLDEQGDLRESANTLFGFRLPVGVKQVSQDSGGAVLQIEVPLDRLARFYTTRGYPVIEGKAGFVVRHDAMTLADEPNGDALKDAELYLRHKAGRVHELRFFLPAREGAPAAPAELEPPKIVVPEGVPRERVQTHEEAIRRWQAEHPGEPFPD